MGSIAGAAVAGGALNGIGVDAAVGLIKPACANEERRSEGPLLAGAAATWFWIVLSCE